MPRKTVHFSLQEIADIVSKQWGGGALVSATPSFYTDSVNGRNRNGDGVSGMMVMLTGITFAVEEPAISPDQDTNLRRLIND